MTPMLRNDLYRLLSVTGSDGNYEARIKLCPESAIYAAHFKEMPVTPGACLVEMACELASEASGVKLDVSEASDIRFLIPVLPDRTETLTFRLERTEESRPALWNVRILDGEQLCARMKLTLE